MHVQLVGNFFMSSFGDLVAVFTDLRLMELRKRTATLTGIIF